MTQQTINVGTAVNDGTGDSLHSAGIKINANFTDLYTQVSNLESIPSIPTVTNNSGKYLTTDGNTITWGSLNLSSYVTASGLTTTLSGYVTTSSLSTTITSSLSSYVTSSNLSTTLSSYATTASLSSYLTTASAASTYATSASVGTSINNITTLTNLTSVGTSNSTVVINGNLTVNGTTSTVNTSSVSTTNKTIILSEGAVNDSQATGSGIVVTSNVNKTFEWTTTYNAWESSEHIDLASGKSYYINGASVLTSSALGSGITSSSLTSLGTLSGLTISNLSGILKATSGVVSTATAGTDYIVPYGNISATYVLAGPTTGSAAAPSFRALVAGDIPTLNQNTTGTASGLSGTQTANYVYAAPNGSSGTAGFRALVAADIPSLNYAATNQTFYLGTTNIAINRSTGSIALTGITSIDGTAAIATNLAGGNSTTLLGSIPYQSNTNTTLLLSPNIGVTKQFLTQYGNGINGAAPAWSSIVAGDLPTSITSNTSGSASSLSGNQTANTVYAGPATGSATTATFRSLVLADLPSGIIATNLSGGNNTTLLGSIHYQSNTNTTTLLSPNTTTTKKFLSQTGTGTNGAAPGWSIISSSDLPVASLSSLGVVQIGSGLSDNFGTISVTYPVPNPTTYTAGLLSTDGYGNTSWATASAVASVISPYISSTWIYKSSAYSASTGDQILVDTSSGAVTITLPSSPTTGGQIAFLDSKGTWGTYPLTVNPNGGTIMGDSTNLVVGTNNAGFTLVYNGSDWRVF
jgi:hypothetical protein